MGPQEVPAEAGDRWSLSLTRYVTVTSNRLLQPQFRPCDSDSPGSQDCFGGWMFARDLVACLAQGHCRSFPRDPPSRF